MAVAEIAGIPVVTLLADVLLFLLKVCICASVETAALSARVEKKFVIFIGVTCQFVILPFCGFILADLLHLEPTYGMALMVIMTSPGGSYSNWWCSLFNADLAMSVAMTGASTIVGVVMLPINLTAYCTLLYGGSVFTAGHFTAVWISLGIILIALVCGLTISHFMDSEVSRDRFNRLANLVGISLFILSIFVSHHQSRTPAWKQPPLHHAAIVTPILAAIAITVGVSSLKPFGLTKPERIAVVIEACYQNPGLATSIVLAMFRGKDAGDAVAVPLLYGMYEAVLLGSVCFIAHYSNWTLVDPKEMSLWKAMAGNFQYRAEVGYTDKKEQEMAVME